LLQSILAKIEANHAGADDALMLDYQGFIAETNATHIFIVHNDKIYTPHTHACPEGVTRTTVLRICEQQNIQHQIKNLSLTELYRSDEVFCTGTMGEIVAIDQVDGRQIGSDKHPMTTRIAKLYSQCTASEGFQIV